jgi:tRNA(Ile2) C34 agmatinyltransferase TiaS
MPRLLPSDKCPKCNGPMKRSPSLFGAVYTCQRCDTESGQRLHHRDAPREANFFGKRAGGLHPME